MTDANDVANNAANANESLRTTWRSLRLTPERAAFLDRIRAASSEPVSITIYASTTWRPIVPMLEGELLVEGLRPEIHTVEYEAIAAELASASASVDVAVLAIDDPDSYGPLYDPRAEFTASIADALLESILARVDRVASRGRSTLVTLPPLPDPRPTGAERTPENETLGARVRRFTSQLERAVAERVGIECLDLDMIHADLGRAVALDPRLWEIGRIRYSGPGFAALAGAIAPHVLAVTGRGIKAVIVDLDNTLWGGVIGEDGVAGIALGDGYPGSCYREFQRELLRLRRAGVLIAVASKNNEADALSVIDSHSEMALRRHDIDHCQIHWEPKPISVGRTLERFNIGQESVLFIDDNPRERAAVARAFPKIRLFDFPEDEPLELTSRLRRLPWPIFGATSDEDQRRAELQAQQVERARAREGSSDDDGYLQSLGIHLEVRVDDPADLKRVAQLHQKTNQFNLDPVRLTESDLAGIQAESNRRVITVRYRDRFGEAGIIAAAVVRDAEESTVVETFLLSCRVIGLGVETALLSFIGQAGAVDLPYRVTEKNAPGREFLARWGDVVGDAGQIRVEHSPEIPSWIELQPENETEEVGHAT